jgi:hypothetical protein
VRDEPGVSIVDLGSGPDGTIYVTEIDEASFLAGSWASEPWVAR